MARVVMEEDTNVGGGYYFARRSNSIEFIPSGAAVLDCLAGDTPILTREYGVVTISSVSGEIVTLLDGDRNWVRCPIIDHGVRKTFATTFRIGSSINSVTIRSTANHGWIGPDSNKIKTNALTCGVPRWKSSPRKREYSVIEYVKPIPVTQGDDYNRGVIHGLIYGDGSRNTGGNRGFNLRVYSEFKLAACMVFLAGFTSKERAYQTTVSSGVYVEFNIPYRYAQGVDFKTLPDASSVSLEYLVGFIRGWFAADGHVSNQPRACLACGEMEVSWLRKWAPVIGWQPLCDKKHPDTTNLGKRNKMLYSLYFAARSMVIEDFLLQHHRDRWCFGERENHDWRVTKTAHDPRIERVYCPVVPTTESFALGDFIHSSNCTLGGGWPISRIANIIGDESTGKTLMAIEACANFAEMFPKGNIYYRESESAFDEPYAEALGMPVDRVKFIEPDDFVTVEDFYADLVKAVRDCQKRDTYGLYIVDSLDALSDNAEQKADFDAASYNTNKAKQIGKLLRMCKAEVSKARMCLIIISQTRDRITEGFMARFAKKKTRSGGKALDFYASQCLWLSHLNTLNATRAKVKRPVGIRIRAKCEKNKISLPYRTCEFTIRFGQGIDSLASSLDWLEEVERWKDVIDVTRKTYMQRVDEMSDKEYWQEALRVDQAVTGLWEETEQLFLEGTRRKYNRVDA